MLWDGGVQSQDLKFGPKPELVGSPNEGEEMGDAALAGEDRSTFSHLDDFILTPPPPMHHHASFSN